MERGADAIYITILFHANRLMSKHFMSKQVTFKLTKI